MVGKVLICPSMAQGCTENAVIGQSAKILTRTHVSGRSESQTEISSWLIVQAAGVERKDMRLRLFRFASRWMYDILRDEMHVSLDISTHGFCSDGYEYREGIYCCFDGRRSC